jgi:hypothetical protein
VLLLVLVVIFALLFKSLKGKQENNAVLASLKRHASVRGGRTGVSLHQNAVYAPNPIAAPGLDNPTYDASHGMGMTNAMYDVVNPAEFIFPLYDEVCHSLLAFHVFGFGIAFVTLYFIFRWRCFVSGASYLPTRGAYSVGSVCVSFVWMIRIFHRRSFSATTDAAEWQLCTALTTWAEDGNANGLQATP